MSAHRLRVPPGLPQRLDILVSRMPGVGSRSRARKMLNAGKVLLDGVVMGATDAGRRPDVGAEIVLDAARPGTAPAKVKARRSLDAAGLIVLYEDDRLVALSKPVGLLTDTATAKQARERDSLSKRARAWLKARGQQALIVHRIDRDTSGVVLLAKDQDAAQHLRRQFRARSPVRVYEAIVHGHISQPGRWVDEVYWHPGQRRLLPAREGGSSLHAACEVRVLALLRGCSQIEVSLISGRRNQIRLQAQLRGHPLVGEQQYLPRCWRAPRRPQLARQALHARRLEVIHPGSGAPLVIHSPLAPDMVALLSACG